MQNHIPSWDHSHTNIKEIIGLNQNLRSSKRTTGSLNATSLSKFKSRMTPSLPDRPTTKSVAREISESLYFGTEKAAVRAYAPEVIEHNREFWIGRDSFS